MWAPVTVPNTEFNGETVSCPQHALSLKPRLWSAMVNRRPLLLRARPCCSKSVFLKPPSVFSIHLGLYLHPWVASHTPTLKCLLPIQGPSPRSWGQDKGPGFRGPPMQGPRMLLQHPAQCPAQQRCSAGGLSD